MTTTAHLPTAGNQTIYIVTERVITFSLLMYALFAPHSIAVTQGSFLLGLLAWGIQLAATRNLRQTRTPVDIALFGFFACCVVSSFLSYDPLTSIKGLRSPALFFAFYLVAKKVNSIRFATLLALILVGSCLASVGYSAGRLAIGKGIRIDRIRDSSAFARTDLHVGDVIIAADGKPVNSPEELSAIVDSQRGRVRITFLRNENSSDLFVSRRLIRRSQAEGAERLGLETSRGRNFRISGIYSHYQTYAEVLQMIGAIALGLFLAQRDKRSRVAVFLGISALLIAFAMIFTSTRATMAGLAVAAGWIALLSRSRRAILLTIVAIILLSPLAVSKLRHSRGSIIFDPQEGSTTYRLEVWHEALALIREHPLFGIGKGSEGKIKEELGLYDGGRLPPGHFHSTIIQIAAWWGLPALICYFALMTIFLREGLKLLKVARNQARWQVWGLSLGSIGALIGFNISSIVHFNFGDGEVVMVLWLVTGLLFAVRRIVLEEETSPQQPTQQQEEGSQKSRSQLQEADVESSARVAGVKLR